MIAVGLMVGAVALTGVFLTGGGIGRDIAFASAEFANCGQGLRTGGDVKLRGVLVGRIGTIQRLGDTGNCDVTLELFPSSLEDLPSNVAAQIRAKTIFGEKWVELVLPETPTDERFGEGDRIPPERTVDPLEIETILNVALPLLDAVDPEYLSGALTALAQGFSGQEDDVIRAIDRGIEALETMNRNEAKFERNLELLEKAGDLFADIDEDLVASLRNLDSFNRFTTANEGLLIENLNKAPELLGELSTLFRVRFTDLVKLVDRGATVIGVLAARTSDLDRLLDVLPRFNSKWIKNLNHVCRYRQATDEPGKSIGDPVPGRCWRVHNLLSHSEGPYGPGEKPRPREITAQDFARLGLTEVTDLTQLLYLPVVQTRTALR